MSSSLKDYKIGKIIGEGSFAYVSLVSRKSDNKIFAMKTSKIGNLSLKEKQSALNEIRILYSLDNPNIISYIDSFFDEESKTLNTVMEYAENGDLSKKILSLKKKNYHFTEKQIWKFTIQILLGMNYLHDNNIIHRDLKSANIFITKKGILKIGDLNISKFTLNGLARTQLGTPYYCSPEIWDDHAYDQKSDVWSVGCIIYELCTLNHPFKGNDIKELSFNIKKGYYEHISNYYSEDLKTLISYMLNVDPRKRFSSRELINCDIVKKKIDMLKNDDISFIFKSNENKCNAHMIDTIRFPEDLNDINKKLPKKKKVKKNIENEMMMNDEYETMKSNQFKNVSKEIKNEIKNEEKKNNNYNHNYFLDKNNNKEKQNYNNDYKIKKSIENGNNKNKFNMKKEKNEPIKINHKEDDRIIQKKNENLLNPTKIITPNPEEKKIYENLIKHQKIENVNNISSEEKREQKNINNKNYQYINNNKRPISSKNKPSNLNKIPNGNNRPSSNIHSNRNQQKNKNNLVNNNVNNNINNNNNPHLKQINISKKNVKIEKFNYKKKKKPISRSEKIYKAMGFNCLIKK